MTPRPEVGSVAEELYARMASLAFADDTVWHMLLFMQAVGLMHQEIEDYIRDTDEFVGYGTWMTIDTVPLKGLGWLVQFVGKRIPSNLSEVSQRTWAKGSDGWDRGSPKALREAARRYLVGPGGDGADAYVGINERVGTEAYRLMIRTLTSETPDPALVFDTLLNQVPGGIILDYTTVDEGTYGLVLLYDAYSDLPETFNTYETMLTNLVS